MSALERLRNGNYERISDLQTGPKRATVVVRSDWISWGPSMCSNVIRLVCVSVAVFIVPPTELRAETSESHSSSVPESVLRPVVEPQAASASGRFFGPGSCFLGRVSNGKVVHPQDPLIRNRAADAIAPECSQSCDSQDTPVVCTASAAVGDGIGKTVRAKNECLAKLELCRLAKSEKFETFLVSLFQGWECKAGKS